MLYTNAISKLNMQKKQDNQYLFRNNNDIFIIYNIFSETDKPLHSFRPLIGVENLKMVSINCFDVSIYIKCCRSFTYF